MRPNRGVRKIGRAESGLPRDAAAAFLTKEFYDSIISGCPEARSEKLARLFVHRSERICAEISADLKYLGSSAEQKEVGSLGECISKMLMFYLRDGP